jgi:hypothetical protein
MVAMIPKAIISCADVLGQMRRRFTSPRRKEAAPPQHGLRYFQDYSMKVAETHGIVYTPQEIVDLTRASVERCCKKNSTKGVNILDRCIGESIV